MDASEYALKSAAESEESAQSRIATTIIDDSRHYRLWEARHADLMVPMAEHRATRQQVMALRNAQVALVHRRALFDHLRADGIRGEKRERLFRLFHATRDYQDAVLAEHQQYMLAVSSNISASYLADIMQDDESTALLRQYEVLHSKYFKMQCYIATSRDSHCVALVREAMLGMKKQLTRVRNRIETEQPTVSGGNFDERELIARSGRYRALNYLNR